MAAPDKNLELVETKEIELFLPIIREVYFGDAFLRKRLTNLTYHLVADFAEVGG